MMIKFMPLLVCRIGCVCGVPTIEVNICSVVGATYSSGVIQ